MKEAVREGLELIGITSVVLVPGCKASQTVDTFPQAATSIPVEPTRIPVLPTRTKPTPTASSGGYPSYIEWCLPVGSEGGIIRLPDGSYQASLGKKYRILREVAPGEYESFYQGQTVPPDLEKLLKCRLKAQR